jgi:hypothetical protein
MTTKRSSYFSPCLLLLTLLLSACGGEQIETDFERYLSRIAGALDTDIPHTQHRPPPPLPDSKLLKNTTAPGSESFKINALELFQLNECQLGQVIAHKNSSLGKVAGHSQQLLSQLQFLHFAPDCIVVLRQKGQTELASRIRQAASYKQQQLPRAIWQATLGGPEFRQLWQQPLSLNNYPSNTNSRPIAALVQLKQLTKAWLSADYEQGWNQLEPLLAQIRQIDAGGLYLALSLQQHYLSTANRLFRENTPLCNVQRANPKQQILLNVVKKYYVQQRQTWSADINRRYHQLMPALTAFEDLLASAEPPAFSQWRQQRDALLASAVQAPKKHITALQYLIADCPGPKR